MTDGAEAPESPDAPEVSGTVRALPANTPFDYQIGGDYPPPSGGGVVARDWFIGSALPGGYSICYVNAFQTQDDDDELDRPDERSNWPASLVLSGFEDDPDWAGEFLVDISTSAKRTAAADHLDPMIQVCADKGFDAVEYDNLDSWTRLDGLPFDRSDSIAFATIITDRAHALGMAVAQKNTADLGAEVSLDVIGFDFAVVEQCGAFDECGRFADVFGDAIVVIEYTDDGFATACSTVGDRSSVVRRDLLVATPESSDYVHDEC
ncbi:endo alpha-1,4 polygalactosaminidase [Ilumatobacter sp.]|uniref:endo alpha-1,4 polygalactosaminidase n=1 Tax=Ilumatobacter sp. TaxID=1967498 RepID=UPI003C709DD3